MNTEREIVERCLKNDVRAQELFYSRFAGKMFGVCLRYAGNPMEAEDILQEGFIRSFLNLHRFRFEGSLEGWVRRTMVNTAINHYKKQLKFQKDVELNEAYTLATIQDDALSRLSMEELLKIIQGLPLGYRTVFNLYVMEGYTHREIGNLLGISENTSKSQYSRARNAIMNRLEKISAIRKSDPNH
ncbi:MAG: RNA polymerase sigma factor [bacterium]